MDERCSRVFIAGAGGMLGRSVYEKLRDVADQVMPSDVQPTDPWIVPADVRDRPALLAIIEKLRPQIIINLAALTDLEYCEMHQDEAWLTNAVGSQNLAQIASDLGATYVYVSTAGVFDGSKETYDEQDSPAPINVYGRTKLEGELFAQTLATHHYVLRCGWMMGGGRKDKKFISLLWRQVLAGTKSLYVVRDKHGSPTYTHDFARLMLWVLSNRCPFGVYHLASSGKASRLEVAAELLRLTGRTDVALQAVDSEHMRPTYFAHRPENEVLVSRKVTGLRGWRECLADYVSTDEFREIGL